MVMIMDGSIGRELSERGIDVKGRYWAANALINNTQELYALYTDYLDAGANLLTANTYGLRPEYFKDDIEKKKLVFLYRTAYDIIQKAIISSKRKNIEITLAFPPLRDTYNAKLILNKKEDIKSEYRILFDGAMHCQYDLILVETLSAVREAEAVLELADEYKKKVWVSFTLKSGTKLNSGETLEMMLSRLSQYKLEALLFNCCLPQYISNSLSILQKADIPFRYGGYANRFNAIKENYSFKIDGPNKLRALSPDEYLKYVQCWIEKGASIVGGCCGIGPEYIKKISDWVIER